MSVGELSRQYQRALEDERLVRHSADGILSAQEIVDEAAQARERAFEQLSVAWLEHAVDGQLSSF